MSLEKILNTLDEQGKIFHEFKKTNDERLSKIEAKAGGIGEVEEKLNRMSAAMDKNEIAVENLEKHIAAVAKPEFGNAKPNAAHKAAFEKFLRTGDDSDMRAIKAAVKTSSDPDGGYAVPENIDSQVDKILLESSPMLQICGTKTFGANYSKLVNVRGNVSANSAELAVIEETETSKLVKVTPVYGKRVSAPLISEESITDIFFDAESWIKEDVAEEMMEDLETEFITGTGQLNATKGFLAYTSTDEADGVREFGKLQYIKSGVNGALATLATGVNPLDKLIDLQTALKEKHHANAIWLMNRSMKGTVRKVKDSDENYVWQPRVSLAEAETLLGYQLRTSHAMPAAGTGSLSIAFGDFKRGITIIIRPGMYVVRDNVTKAPNIRFVFSKRYGLMLRNSEAIKLLMLAS